MLVRSFEMLDGQRRLVAEGNIPENQARQLHRGDQLNITRVRPAISQVGATEPIVRGEIVIGQYEITDVQERRTAADTPSIEIVVRQIS